MIKIIPEKFNKFFQCGPNDFRKNMKKMDEIELPVIEDLLFMFHAEGGTIFACPLNIPLFDMTEKDLLNGVKLADPATYYKDVVLRADMNLTF